MSRYKSSKLKNLGPVHGFTIHTPDDRQLKDLHPQAIVSELNRLSDRIKRLEDRIKRASAAFFSDRSDRQTASGMLAILEEERVLAILEEERSKP